MNIKMVLAATYAVVWTISSGFAMKDGNYGPNPRGAGVEHFWSSVQDSVTGAADLVSNAPGGDLMSAIAATTSKGDWGSAAKASSDAAWAQMNYLAATGQEERMADYAFQHSTGCNIH